MDRTGLEFHFVFAKTRAVHVLPFFSMLNGHSAQSRLGSGTLLLILLLRLSIWRRFGCIFCRALCWPRASHAMCFRNLVPHTEVLQECLWQGCVKPRGFGFLKLDNGGLIADWTHVNIVQTSAVKCTHLISSHLSLFFSLSVNSFAILQQPRIHSPAEGTTGTATKWIRE